MFQPKLTQAEELDLLSIDQLVQDLDEEMTKELLSCFLTDTSDVIDQIDTALQAGDGEASRKAAHIMTGCCRSVNAHAAERLSKRIEHCAQDGDFTEARKTVLELQEVFQATASLALKYVQTDVKPGVQLRDTKV